MATTTTTTATTVIPFLAHHHRDLRFDGTNVTQFLKTYNRHAEAAAWSTRQRCMSFLDFCTPAQEEFIEKLPEYEASDWLALQACLRIHYASEDHAQYASNRAYLESFVQQCNVQPLDLIKYYAEFLAIANACVERGQLHQEEQGWYFFKGLSKEDQSLVMFNMPEGDRPDGDSTSSFDFQKIFKFLQKMDKQKQSIVNCSAAYCAVNAQRAKEAYQHSQQGLPSSSSVQDIIQSIINQDTRAYCEENQYKNQFPNTVDLEPDEPPSVNGALSNYQDGAALSRKMEEGPHLAEQATATRLNERVAELVAERLIEQAIID